MLMKKGFLGLLFAVNTLAAISQTPDDAKKNIYYERYATAEDQLQKSEVARIGERRRADHRQRAGLRGHDG